MKNLLKKFCLAIAILFFIQGMNIPLIDSTTTSLVYADDQIASGRGLKGEYFSNEDLTDLQHTRVDSTINFDWKNNPPAPGLDKFEFSIRWTGQIEPRFTETYTFKTETHGGIRLWVNGQIVIDNWGAHNTIRESGTIYLEAGKRYDIKIGCRETNGIAKVELYWQSASQAEEIVPSSQLYPIGTIEGITAIPAEKSIALSWKPLSYAKDYEIKVDGVIVDRVNLPGYVVKGLVPGTQHEIRIRAINNSVSDIWSEPVTVITLIGKPSEWNFETTEDKIELSWPDVEGAHFYDVEVNGVTFNNGDNTTFIHSDLTSGTQHVYRIRARSLILTGEWTDEIKRWTLPCQVGNLTANATETEIALEWDAVTGATAYDIEINGTIFECVSSRYLDVDLIPGTEHKYRVRAKNSSGSGKWSEELIKRTVVGAISNAKFSATETEVSIGWDPVLGATGYDMYVDGTLIESVANPYNHINLFAGTLHSYRVRAKNEHASGKWSEEYTRWTLPGIPANVRGTAAGNSITIEWDEVMGASGYDIEILGTAVDCGDNIKYTHNGLRPNTQQTYRVRAKNSSGVGKWSNIVVKTTLPAIPDNLQVKSWDTKLELIWDAVSGAESYDVEVNGIVKSGIADTTYLHINLLSNTVHIFRVRSRNENGVSEWSQSISKATLPSRPVNIQANTSSKTVTLTWSQVMGATGYDIEADGALVQIGNETSYTHTGLESSSEHTYRVRAKNGSIVSEWSEEILTKTVPEKPSNIYAQGATTNITVTWYGVYGATGYEIEADGQVIDVGLDNTYIHNALIPNTAHSYRVRAKNSGGAGEWSELTTVSTLLGIPDGLAAESTSTSIRLSWGAVPGATGYDILADGVLISNISDTTYFHTGLKPYTSHIYRVRARVGQHTAGWSRQLIDETLVSVPADINTLAERDQIIIKWSAVTGATGYELDADGIILEVTSPAFEHKKLKPNKLYTYRVRAKNNRGKSDWSEITEQLSAPEAPKNLKAKATADEIVLRWDKADGAIAYDIEVDGVLIEEIVGEDYVHTLLAANTLHTYRVRSKNDGGISDWSEKIRKRTNPQISANTEKDNFFNFVIMLPKSSQGIRTIVVEYNPDELEVIDLCASTSRQDLKTGIVEGTNINVIEFAQGKIVFEVGISNKAAANSIKFLAKTNGYSKITYTIE